MFLFGSRSTDNRKDWFAILTVLMKLSTSTSFFPAGDLWILGKLNFYAYLSKAFNVDLARGSKAYDLATISP